MKKWKVEIYIYTYSNNKLDKPKKAHKNEMQNENDPFLKIETKVTTWDKKNKKWYQRPKQQKFRKQVWLLSKKEIASLQQVAIQQQAIEINLSDQSLTEGLIELLKLG